MSNRRRFENEHIYKNKKSKKNRMRECYKIKEKEWKGRGKRWKKKRKREKKKISKKEEKI